MVVTIKVFMYRLTSNRKFLLIVLKISRNSVILYQTNNDIIGRQFNVNSPSQ